MIQRGAQELLGERDGTGEAEGVSRLGWNYISFSNNVCLLSRTFLSLCDASGRAQLSLDGLGFDRHRKIGLFFFDLELLSATGFFGRLATFFGSQYFVDEVAIRIRLIHRINLLEESGQSDML